MSESSAYAQAAATHNTAPPADKSRFDLYLLVGQSNMAGRGRVEPADAQPVERVLVFDRNDTWVSQGEPVHFDKVEAGVGLSFTFAKLAATHNPHATVGLIPCAVGGTPISRWMPGADLYEEAVRRAKLALRSGTLRGILWHQGEAESHDRERAEAYAERLATVLNSFRKELGAPEVPVVVGELGEFLFTRRNAQGDNPTPLAQIVNAQIRQIPQIVSHSAVALSHGLTHGGDVLHFDAPSLKTFGQRYFDAYLQIGG